MSIQIIEECAKIAEDHVGAGGGPGIARVAYDEACHDIAQAIRDAFAAGQLAVTPQSEIPTDDPDPAVNLPFERIPQHAGDPGFGPVPNVIPMGSSDPKHPSNTPAKPSPQERSPEHIRLRGIAESCAISILQRLIANYDTDRDCIGDSDLDNEQPIAITFRGTLGDIRNARKSLQCYSALSRADGGAV
jgi:hypothetical protein